LIINDEILKKEQKLKESQDNFTFSSYEPIPFKDDITVNSSLVWNPLRFTKIGQ